MVRRFDCGSGVAVVRTTNVVDVGKWNEVTIHRRDWSAWIRLNDGTQAAGRSKVRSVVSVVDKTVRLDRMSVLHTKCRVCPSIFEIYTQDICSRIV